MILCPGSSVCREKTGIIKLWALWQEWRGRSWIMLHLNLSGEGPRKGPQGRRKMAATIGKSKPNESLSFPDPSTTRDTVAAHLLPHPCSDNLSSSAGFHSANAIASNLSPMMHRSMSTLPVLDTASAPTECPLTSQHLEKFLLFWVSKIYLTM